jgi:hypothetical protein
MTDDLQEYERGDELDHYRLGVIEQAEQLDYVEMSGSILARMKVSRTPYPPIPREMWGVVDLIVPAEGAREGDDFLRVPSTPAMIDMYWDVGTPDLESVNLAGLSIDELGRFYSYCNTYLSYLDEQTAIIDAQKVTLEHRRRWAFLEFQGMYQGVKTVSERKRRAELEPYITRLDFHINTNKTLLMQLKAKVTALLRTSQLASREVTRRQTMSRVHPDLSSVEAGVREAAKSSAQRHLSVRRRK